MKLIPLLSIACACTYFISNGNADELKEYELQMRCAKQAEKYFAKDDGGQMLIVKEGTARSTYINHYNKKQNKCFILMTNYLVPTKQSEFGSTLVLLADISENKTVGIFWKSEEGNDGMRCNIADKHCNSKEAWEATIKPYMEE